MYTQQDMCNANALVRRYGLILGLGLALLLACYVSAILAGSQLLMLLIALAAFWFAMLLSCIWLYPACKYRAFLRDMNRGLRREYLFTVDKIHAEVVLRDGVRVNEMQVILENGDTRIFYLNISKSENFPAEGSKIHITAYGRHILQWEENN